MTQPDNTNPSPAQVNAGGEALDTDHLCLLVGREFTRAGHYEKAASIGAVVRTLAALGHLRAADEVKPVDLEALDMAGYKRGFQDCQKMQVASPAKPATDTPISEEKAAGDWYCRNCGYLSSSRVTYSETCDTCHVPVVWHEAFTDEKVIDRAAMKLHEIETEGQEHAYWVEANQNYYRDTIRALLPFLTTNAPAEHGVDKLVGALRAIRNGKYMPAAHCSEERIKGAIEMRDCLLDLIDRALSRYDNEGGA